MINKILVGILAALVAAFYWQSTRLDEARERVAMYSSANEVLARSVGELDQARQVSERVAVERYRKWQAAERGRARFERDLMEAKQTNEVLREHLDGVVPGDMVDGLRLRAGQGGACEEGGSTGAVPGTDTCSPTVTFERLYRWVGDVVDGVLSCNADKAAVRAWMEGG